MMVTRRTSRRNFRFRLGGTLLVCSALVALATAGAGDQAAASAGRLHAVLTSYLAPVGKAAAVPLADHPLGAARAATPLHIDVVLEPRNPAAMTSFATAVSTPGNPLYGHFLARGQFASVFGPTPATISAVTAVLRQAGLRPGAITPDHLIIPVSANVGLVERALHVSLRLYRQPAGTVPATAIVNTDAPTLPSAIARDVQGIIGLDTVSSRAPGPIAAHRHPRLTAVPSVVPTSGPIACATAKAVAKEFSGWTETQLAQAYSFDGVFAKGDLGKGVTIALFEEQTYSKSDIAKFQSCYHTHVPLTNVSVDGGSKDADFSPEAALDIETVIGLAPKASVRVYETIGSGTGPTDGYDKIVTQDKAQVISSSWSTAPFGCDVFVPESVIKAENSIFKEAAIQGQSTFVADGDVGSEGCMANGSPAEISQPPGPDAVAVDPATQTVYFANSITGDITVANEATLETVGTIALGSTTEPEGLAVDPTTNQLWVSEDALGIVAEIDGATCDSANQSGCSATPMTVINDPGSEPIGIAVDSATGTAYVALAGIDDIGVIDEAMDTFVGAYGGDEPADVAVDASTDQVFLTDFGDDEVGEFSGAACDATTTSGCPTSLTLAEVSVGEEPYGLAVNASSNKLYIGNAESDTVTVLEASTGDFVATATLSGLVIPTSLAVDPNGSGVLVTAEGSDGSGAGVAVISGGTNKVTRLITGITDPYAVATDPLLDYAWVADAAGGFVWMPLFLSVEDPSEQPFVTGVGGTDLTKLGPAPTQSVWDEPLFAEGAGTGGISSWWTMPKYQRGPGVVSSLSSGVPCGATGRTLCRELPDVSASADPSHGYVIVFGGKWTVVGGTSAATPLWAALTALLDAYKGKVHKLGFLNPALYKLVAEGKAVVNDVKVGNNDYTTTNGGLYPATKHYDMATGLGTPIVTALAKALG